uniref:RNase H type-1 domain-containing protein n=1 Tax=Chenopodium quinoa TaxID=63459 RepID=A0A803KPS9_CHEQI
MFSDHAPLILEVDPPKENRRASYKMEAWCLKLEEVKLFIAECWKKDTIGSPLYKTQKKVNHCLMEVKSWFLKRKDQSHNLNWQQIKEDFEMGQAKEALDNSVGEKEIAKRQEIVAEATMECWYWRQRAKSRWDAFRDQSTSFFYKSVKERAPLKVKSTKELGNYLGCPMDVEGRSCSKFSIILEKIQRKISSWKFSNLPQAKKLILINGVVVSLANNILSIFWCPSNIISKIEGILSNFWWAKKIGVKGTHWRKKETLQLHKHDGGLASKIFKARYGSDPATMGYTGKRISRGSWATKSYVRAASTLKDKIAWKSRQDNDGVTWQAAIAWMIEENNQVQIQRTSRTFATTLTQAEGLAVLKALQEVPSRFGNLIIKTDSSTLVQGLRKPDKTLDELIKHIVQDIRLTVGKRDFVACVKTRRSAVQKAHNLAVSCRKYGAPLLFCSL